MFEKLKLHLSTLLTPYTYRISIFDNFLIFKKWYIVYIVLKCYLNNCLIFMFTAAINCRSFDVLFCHQDDLESCNKPMKTLRKVSGILQKIKTCCKILQHFSLSLPWEIFLRSSLSRVIIHRWKVSFHPRQRWVPKKLLLAIDMQHKRRCFPGTFTV